MTDGPAAHQAQTLDLSIQRAWEYMTRMVGGRRVRIFVTPDGFVKIQGQQVIPHTAVEVGTFTKAIGLCDFRSEVFDVYDKIARGVR